ncbi:pleiotropic regulatory protein RsmS [Aliivibrio sifiae]|uniref:pleiotropic regulatory protein RsmS n=1 Tax=Aliivibrio sifiae TaxID=566293 RepID=UPI00155F53F8
METEKTNSPLDNAPDDVKLAVDLIYLLENNHVEKQTAISALKMVLNDYENK